MSTGSWDWKACPYVCIICCIQNTTWYSEDNTERLAHTEGLSTVVPGRESIGIQRLIMVAGRCDMGYNLDYYYCYIVPVEYYMCSILCSVLDSCIASE
jgi:hypothetical protein